MIDACIDRYDADTWTRISSAIAARQANRASRFRLALPRDLLWTAGQTLHVRFLDGDPALHREVLAIGQTWSAHANLRFAETRDEGAHIRVTFTGRANWSRIGRLSLQPIVPGANVYDEPSMGLPSVPGATDDAKRRFVLHELGHALGCIHEHQSPAAGISWKRDAVIAYYDAELSPAEIEANWFERYDASMTQFSDYDATSIMHYPIPAELVRDPRDAVGWNAALSPLDQAHIAAIYPRRAA